MKALIRLVAGLSVLTLLISCSSSIEQKANAAYSAAQKLQGDEKRLKQKTAYMLYDRAIKRNPNRASMKLRNRYVELTLVRANMVLNEGAAKMDAIPLFMEDIDKFMTPEVNPELKQQYAMFLLQLADSSIAKEKFDEAIQDFDKAVSVASDPSAIQAKRQAFTQRIADENLKMAQSDYDIGKQQKDVEAFVRAEYYTNFCLLFDSTNAEAKKILSTLHKENLSTYSAYLKVIEYIPDSSLFRKVNKYDILLAIPTVSSKGGSVNMVVNMYNYSYNPLRLKAEQFSIIDSKGNKLSARPARLDPEILDQEHEAKLKLSFPAPSGAIQKLIYENAEHYTEKSFL
jgi:tetratricopeptide (TPR) repeat protein